jgi:uncharacterized protein
MSVEKILNRQGTRKLLALDGGGIRGLITIEVLAELERQIKAGLVSTGKLTTNDPFVLADYFDYIAGTSTGAIIATALSTGMSVDEIRRFYEDSGAAMFEMGRPFKYLKKWLNSRYQDNILTKKIRNFFWHSKYEDKALANILKKTFGVDTKLGDGSLKTLLMLVMRNVTTDSPWPLSNNPKAKYNDRDRLDCNLYLPLWKLIRASTAAPTFFPPEQVTVGKRKFIFVDGGITPYNNPAFQLFLMATAEPYKLCWPTGEDRMLLVSVGTGLTPNIQTDLDAKKMNLLYQATSLPTALMFAAQNEQDMLCRIFGKCLAGESIDGEVGDLIGATGAVNPKLFTYVRYDAELSQKGLERLGLKHLNAANIQQMDSVKYMSELQEVGKAVAKKVNFSEKDFGAFFSVH